MQEPPRQPHRPPPILSGGLPPGYAPETSGSSPPVIVYFRVYCGVMLALSLLWLAMGLFAAISPVFARKAGPDTVAPLVMGAVYAGSGAFGCALYGLGLAAPRKPFMYIYGVVLIALAMTTVCCLPVTIPLLINWLKPEVKGYFEGKG